MSHNFSISGKKSQDRAFPAGQEARQEAVADFLEAFLGERNLEMAGRLAAISRSVRLRKREPLFAEGEEGDLVYYLVSGQIKLFKINEEGKELVIHFVRPGELFAEILFFMKNRYPVSAEALEPCVLLGISSRGLQGLIRDNSEFALRLIGMLAGRLKHFVRTIESLTLTSVRGRFVNYLLSQVKRRGDRFRLPVSKGDFALLLGIAPETFSRLLRQLSDEGAIAVSGREIALLADPGGLGGGAAD